MIVNKIIIILCIIFLILLLRKLTYENFQTTTTSSYSSKIRYRDRPTNDVNQRKQDIITEIKSLDADNDIMKQILNPLKEYSRNSVSGVNIDKLNSKIEKINKASDELRYLSKNNIINDNDNISRKMFDHLNHIIAQNKQDTSSDLIKHQMIKEKMNKINNLISKNSNNKLKSITCKDNGKTLNIVEITNSYYDNIHKSQNNKEYKININNKYLFYELRNQKKSNILLDNGRQILIDSVCKKIGSNKEANKFCKFIPTDGYYESKSDDETSKPDYNNNIDYNGREIDLNKWDSDVEDETYDYFKDKSGLYFYIKHILDMKEYNNVIKKTGNLRFEMGNIEYPFYIVQPTNHPDMCVNLKEDKVGNTIITIEKCSNTPTERFDGSVVPINCL